MLFDANLERCLNMVFYMCSLLVRDQSMLRTKTQRCANVPTRGEREAFPTIVTPELRMHPIGQYAGNQATLR
jgi:hypothetical protein